MIYSLNCNLKTKSNQLTITYLFMYYERAITRLSYFFIKLIYYFVFTLYRGIIYFEYRYILTAAVDWHSTEMVTVTITLCLWFYRYHLPQ